MFCIFADLTNEEKVILLNAMFEMYYDTDQDADEFSKEYYYLSSEILKGRIPIKLNYLIDFENRVLDLIPRLNDYYRPFKEINISEDGENESIHGSML